MGNKSKFLWGYSVVLFTVAFVLIFMSAVSQRRLRKMLRRIESTKQTTMAISRGTTKCK